MTTLNFNNCLLDLEKDLRGFAYRLTSNKEETKDLVQETYLKALRYCNKFVYNSSLKAWTFTIMKNIFINNYHRIPRIRKFTGQSNEDSIHRYTITDGSFYPESVYISKELEIAIEMLNEDLKIPFKMHHEGFSYKEIAVSLDIKPGTVKSRIFIARKHLKEQVTR
jgi:RNA polymerase sigma-70 factor (ECF subfamily)